MCVSGWIIFELMSPELPVLILHLLGYVLTDLILANLASIIGKQILKKHRIKLIYYHILFRRKCENNAINIRILKAFVGWENSENPPKSALSHP